MPSISPFIVAIPTIVEYIRSFLSRPDLFRDRKYLVAPTFETSVQRVFKGFLWFRKPSFHLLSSRIKSRVLKNGSIFILTLFVCALKINMDKTPGKVTKDPKNKTEVKITRDIYEEATTKNTRR